MFHIINRISNRYRLIFSLITVLLGLCQVTNAENLYTLGATSSSSSDDIDLNDVQLRYVNNRREYAWPYAESADSDWDWGIELHRYFGQASGTDFAGLQLQGLFGWHYSKNTYIHGAIGAHRLDVPSAENQKERATYDLNAQLGITKTFNLKLNTADNYVYQYGLQPAGAREYLNAHMSSAGFDWRPTERIRFSGSHSYWDLSDENTRRQYKYDLVYGISPGWPWIWAGLTYERLEYDMDKIGYWTPGYSRTAGLVFDSSFPVTENLTGAFSASLTRIKEDEYPEGDGGSLYIGIDYKLTKQHTLRMSFNRILSSQQSSTWSENTYYLSLNGAL